MKRVLVSAVLVLGLLGLTVAYVLPTPVSPEAIESSVIREPALLELGWHLPVAASFNPDLIWQSNASLCGPASLANVFRSLGEAPTTETDVLSGTGKCWFGICPIGLTLDEVAEVARTHTKRNVTVLRDLTPDEFRGHLRSANDPSRRYIVNFARGQIFGAGVGHHSPIGGYLEEQDLVFVLDVNHDFQPWFIESSRLFAAMDTLDGDRKRGLLLIE